MITADIGTNGRLGNQMFQYAALLGVALKQGLECGIDYKAGNNLSWKEYPIDVDYNLMTIDKAFNLSLPQLDNLYPTIFESHEEFHFQERFFHTGDNIKLRGYFQSSKYFEHCKDLIRKEFIFKSDIVDAANSFLSDKRQHETVSIHVRRGDYLMLPHHGVCDMSYYSTALSTYFCDKLYNFIVITDDIHWAKSTFVGGNNFFISETRNQFVDLCIMSLCNHNIIANSSYSWWGSWLNAFEDKKIIAPSVWFS